MSDFERQKRSEKQLTNGKENGKLLSRLTNITVLPVMRKRKSDISAEKFALKKCGKIINLCI